VRITCNSRLLYIYEMRLEHAFWGFEPFLADFDDPAVWKLG
jgi:hypothetical protein